MVKGQVSMRNASKRIWDNATPEVKEKKRVYAREYYYKNKEKLTKKLSKKKRRLLGFMTRHTNQTNQTKQIRAIAGT